MHFDLTRLHDGEQVKIPPRLIQTVLLAGAAVQTATPVLNNLTVKNVTNMALFGDVVIQED